jgi:hypothetical protein
MLLIGRYHFEAAFLYNEEAGAEVLKTVDLFACNDLSIEHVVFYILTESILNYSYSSVRL